MAAAPFRWTRRRDILLASAIADNFTYREAARMVGDGCTEEDARRQMRELRRERAQQLQHAETARVPRPVRAPIRQGLIDLRNAPSMMEERARQWAAKA